MSGLLLIFGIITSGWWPIHPFKNTVLKERIKIIYDSNIFRYSSRQLEEITEGKYPYRYPFRSADDVIIRSNLTVKRSGNPGLRFRITLNLYTLNPEKSYYSFEGKVEKFPISIGLTGKPHYLIRYFYDPDTTSRTYIPCYYSELGLFGELKKGVLNLRITIRGRDYNDNFEEYSGFLVGGEGNAEFSSISWGLAFEKYIAKGYNEPGERRLSSDDADISENRFMLKIRKSLSLKNKNKLNLFYRLRLRDFTTTKEDPLHRGRRDLEHLFSCELSKVVNRRVNLRAGFSIETRKVISIETRKVIKEDSPLEEIQDIKNYTRIRTWAGVTFTN